MAGPEGSKYYDIFLNYSVWLETRGESIVLSSEGLDLLSEVERVESIVTAARNMGMSYRKAWGLLREVESMIQFPLIKKHRGGASGGRTLLTPEGRELVTAYAELSSDIDMAMKGIAKKFFRKLNRDYD
jgi:molybdate transport system regulatory protein